MEEPSNEVRCQPTEIAVGDEEILHSITIFVEPTTGNCSSGVAIMEGISVKKCAILFIKFKF